MQLGKLRRGTETGLGGSGGWFGVASDVLVGGEVVLRWWGGGGWAVEGWMEVGREVVGGVGEAELKALTIDVPSIDIVLSNIGI